MRLNSVFKILNDITSPTLIPKLSALLLDSATVFVGKLILNVPSVNFSQNLLLIFFLLSFQILYNTWQTPV